MITPILPEITDAEALAYGLVNLDLPVFEKEFNVLLEELSFDNWLSELEEAAAYRALVASHASYGYRTNFV
jgi:hypothetical protein